MIATAEHMIFNNQIGGFAGDRQYYDELELAAVADCLMHASSVMSLAIEMMQSARDDNVADGLDVSFENASNRRHHRTLSASSGITGSHSLDVRGSDENEKGRESDDDSEDDDDEEDQDSESSDDDTLTATPTTVSTATTTTTTTTGDPISTSPPFVQFSVGTDSNMSTSLGMSLGSPSSLGDRQRYNNDDAGRLTTRDNAGTKADDNDNSEFGDEDEALDEQNLAFSDIASSPIGDASTTGGRNDGLDDRTEDSDGTGPQSSVSNPIPIAAGASGESNAKLRKNTQNTAKRRKKFTFLSTFRRSSLAPTK